MTQSLRLIGLHFTGYLMLAGAWLALEHLHGPRELGLSTAILIFAVQGLRATLRPRGPQWATLTGWFIMLFLLQVTFATHHGHWHSAFMTGLAWAGPLMLVEWWLRKAHPADRAAHPQVVSAVAASPWPYLAGAYLYGQYAGDHHHYEGGDPTA